MIGIDTIRRAGIAIAMPALLLSASVQAGGVQAGGVQAGGVQAGGVQAGGVQAGGAEARGAQTGRAEAKAPQTGISQAGSGAQQTPAQPDIPVLTARIVARYPHDATAFTEGLAWANGSLYESTGLEGRSEVRRVALDGRITARARIDPKQFGEGLAIWRDQIVTLTWHDGVAHRWNARTLRPVGSARYSGEGWGLAAQADTLAMTDGSPTIRFFDAATFRETRRVTVTLRGKPLPEVNELEYVDGALLANVWHTGFLVRIDPATGKVNAIVDLRPIVAEIAATDPEAVANGIAWDGEKRRLFVTGKLWPTVFEIAIPPA